MKYLVVVRHGDYRDSSLSVEGRQQIRDLGILLAQRINGSSVALLSSPAMRAKETSEILADHLGGIAFEEHKCLHSGGGCFYGGQEQEALRLVEERGQTHDVVVLSTHLEFIDSFPSVWGVPRGFRLPNRRNTPKGTARLIDIEMGQEEHLCPART